MAGFTLSADSKFQSRHACICGLLDPFDEHAFLIFNFCARGMSFGRVLPKLKISLLSRLRSEINSLNRDWRSG